MDCNRPPSDHDSYGCQLRSRRKWVQKEDNGEPSCANQQQRGFEKKPSPCVSSTGVSSTNRNRKRKHSAKSSCSPYVEISSSSSKHLAEIICPPQFIDLTNLSSSSSENKRKCLRKPTDPSIVDLTELSSSSSKRRRKSIQPFSIESISSASSGSGRTSSSCLLQELLSGCHSGAGCCNDPRVFCSYTVFKEKYCEERLLGCGGFGSVWAGYRKEDLLPVAVKHIRQDNVTWVTVSLEGRQQEIPLEVALLLIVGSGSPAPKGIVRLLDCCNLPHEVLLVLERPVPCEDLFDYVANRSVRLEEEEAKVIMRQLVEAVQVIHQRGVVHRDLKPENVLIESHSTHLQTHLIDFGCANLLRKRPFTRFRGTSLYTAPEWFTENKLHGVSSTVWQLGVIMFEILHQCRPFSDTREIIEKPLILQEGLSAGDNEVAKTMCSSGSGHLQMHLVLGPAVMVPTMEEILHHSYHCIKPSSPSMICHDGNGNVEGEESVPSPGNSTSDEEWRPCTDRTPAGDAKPVRRETRKHVNHLHRCPLLGCNGKDDAAEKQPQEEEEPTNDDHFYCEECQSFYLEECEIHGPPSFTSDSQTPLGVPQRALLTLPPGLMVGCSSIPGAGLGVFNQGKIVPVGMHFGPFVGEVTSREKAIESSYSWVICKKKNQYEYIDGSRDSHSNWMRYVNCARNEEEQNLVAFQHRGRVLYRCCRPITIGQELLVCCADEYSKELGVICNSLWIKKCTIAAASLEKPSQVFKCSQCKFSSSAEHCVQKHTEHSHFQIVKDPLQSESEDRSHSCCECGQSFSSLGELRKHERISHTGEESHCCSECGQCFNQLIGLKRHKQRHSRERPYVCTQCDKTFCWFAGLQRHSQRHIAEKSYLCTECGKCFYQSGDLKRHQKIHTGEKLYLCTDCGKSFSRFGSLRQHQRIHTGEKPYCCTYCGKCFSYSEQLKVHVRTHTGEKPFLCTECGESFRQSGDLKRHERKHTGVRPCRCDECGKSFSRPNSLKAHQLLHKGERPYHCPQCDKCFIRTGHLRRHLKKMHS